MKRKTTEEYKKEIENLDVVCLEEYINDGTKILHKCKKCGYEWKIKPNNILHGQNCPKCSRKSASKKLRKTTEEYKKEIENLDVVCLEEYINANTKILHKCKNCGNTWKVTPNIVLSGYGCPICSRKSASKKLRKTTEQYKKELESFDIICLEEYTNNKTKILHKCKKCGYEWKILPNAILNGNGCPKCAGNKKKTTEEYKKEIENLDVICLEEYINARTKILHRCKKCGYEWKILPRDILSGYGCPHCNFSHGEKAIEKFLIESNVSFNPQKWFSDCRDKMPLPFDFYLPELNVAIEYQGIQHYKAIEKFGGEKRLHLQRHHDWLKRKYCEKKGINLITIKYDENIENKLNFLLKENLI